MKLHLVALSVILAYLTQQVPTVSASTSEVQGFLLVTGDATLVKEERKGFRFQSLADLAKRFPADKYLTAKWDDHWQIVVDRTTGPLGKIRDRILLSKGISKKVDASGTLDVSGMSVEEFEATQSLFGKWPTDPSGHSMQPSVLGIDASYRIEFRTDGVTRRMNVRLPDRAAKMRDAVASRTKAVHQSSAKTPISDHPAPRDEFDFVFLGRRSGGTSEGLRLACNVIKDLETQMSREQRAEGDSLMKALGLSEDPSGGKASDISGLPDRLRSQLQDQWADSWKGMGFSNRTEAIEALSRAGSFSVQTSLSLRQTLDQGDPERGHPSVAVGFEFLTIPGSYLP